MRIDKAAFEKCRSDSIDYAVMEKTRDAVVLPLDAGWSDVGSWASLFDALPSDEDGNVLRGDVLVHDTHDCYVHSTSRLVTAVGMDDHVIVETKDAVLVAPKERVQDVKDLVAKLKKSGRGESSLHREVFRPWGSYDSLDAGDRFQVKRLSVKPNGVLSLQMHHHRAEHWIVVQGTARITCNDKTFLLSENESTYIPIGATHRIENPGQGRSAHRRSPIGILSRRGRHRALPGQLRPAGNEYVTAITCFKAYDLRGRIPTELNDDVAYRVGRAYAEFLRPKRVVVGRDIRLSSEGLTDALCRGLMDGGADVFDIGICGTEGVYFATFDGKYDGGIMVTASHNPPDYNGMKFVREQSKPISGDNGLKEIRAIAERGGVRRAQGSRPARAHRHRRRPTSRISCRMSISQKLKPLRIVVNAGNGGAGTFIDLLEPHLPFEFIKVHHQADGHFPNGIPNPMIEENRAPTVAAIRAHRADLGLAWDGDFDRCFFFDENGQFIEGYYIVGLLASVLLKGERGGKVVHDPRLTWNTIEIVRCRGRRGGRVQVGACLHQAAHARGRRGLRRRDERASLLSGASPIATAA